MGADRGKGFMLIAVMAMVVIIATVVVIFANRMSQSAKDSMFDQETAALDGLRSKILEFSRLNRQLPSDTEFATLSSGFTDRLSRSPIYIASSALTSSDICLANTSPITFTECGSDASCGSPAVTQNIPFALLLAGQTVVNPASPVSQTTTLTGTALVSTPTNLTSFSPETLVGSQADRTQEIGVYDDRVAISSFPEIWNAMGCKEVSQGDVVTRGTSVRILNIPGSLPTAPVGVSYDTSSAPFVAYGSNVSTYNWSVAGLPGGLALTSLGNKAYISGIPASGTEGTYSVTISVTAVSPYGNSPTHSVTMTLVVCPYWSLTGLTQTSACPAGYTGAIVQQQIKETCTNTLQWVDQSNTCTLVATPAVISAALSSATLAAAGYDTGQRNMGISTITLNDITITAGSTSGTPKNISLNGSGTAIGVVNIGATSGHNVSGTETLSFAFSSNRDTLALAFAGLGRKTPGFSYETVELTFSLGGAVVATVTRTACTVTNESQNTRVAFNDIAPGTSFDSVRIRPSSSGADFYVAGIAACTGSSCQTSSSANAQCP